MSGDTESPVGKGSEATSANYGLQVLGLRPFFNKFKNREELKQWYPPKRIYASDITEILESHEDLLSPIPEGERWNLYFTAGYVNGESSGKSRQFKKVDILWFDIDPLKKESGERYVLQDPERVWRVASEALSLDPESEVGAIFSGHGVQLFIQLDKGIESPSTEWFDLHRESYGRLCERITEAIQCYGINAKCDPSVFSNARFMRVPGTINRKKGEADVKAYVISANVSGVKFFLESSGSKAQASLPLQAQASVKTPPGPQVILTDDQKKTLEMWGMSAEDCLPGEYSPPDEEAILSTCGVIKKGFENPRALSEPLWYYSLSILARLYPQDPDKARELCHKFSKGPPENRYKLYDFNEVEAKIDRALKDTGPVSCGKFDSEQSKKTSICRKCPKWKDNVRLGKFSPMLIKGEGYVRTKDTHFRLPDKQTGTLGKIVFSDLLKQFQLDYTPKTIEENQDVYVYKDGKYKEFPKSRLGEYITERTSYDIVMPSDSQVREFISKVKFQGLVSQDEFFTNSIDQKTNLKNGVYDFKKNEFVPHSPDYGFLYKLPFEYDPSAKCPEFDEFIKWFSSYDPEIEECLWGMLGYVFSGDKPWLEKMFVLDGDGNNGKSTLIKLIHKLIGRGNISSLSLDDMKKNFAPYQMIGKLANLSGESSKDGLKETHTLKALISGDPLQVDRKNKDPVVFENRAKMIFNVNLLSHIQDTSHGFYRKFMLIPCNAHVETLKKKQRGYEDVLFKEASGIFNKAIEEYKKVQERGEIREPGAVKEAKSRQRIDSDVVAAWVEDEFFEYFGISNSEDDSASVDDMFRLFNAYADGEGKQAVNKTNFSKRLRTYLKQKDARFKYESKRLRKGGPKQTFLCNIETHTAYQGQFTNNRY